jgi:hypothetical protein
MGSFRIARRIQKASEKLTAVNKPGEVEKLDISEFKKVIQPVKGSVLKQTPVRVTRKESEVEPEKEGN